MPVVLKMQTRLRNCGIRLRNCKIQFWKSMIWWGNVIRLRKCEIRLRKC